jgi:Zn-dependent protease with chaperone function
VRRNEATATFRLGPTPSAGSGELRPLIGTIRFSPTAAHRAGVIIWSLIAVAVAEAILLKIDDLATATSDSGSVAARLLVLLIALAVFAALLVYAASLWIASEIFGRYEVEFVKRLTDEGIEAKPLTAKRHWTLFPGDTIVVFGAILAAVVVQIVDLTDGWYGFRLFEPLIWMVPLYLVSVLVREIAFSRLEVDHDIHAYWRLRAAQLFGPVSLFMPPLLFFVLCGAGLSVNIVDFHAASMGRAGETLSVWRDNPSIPSEVVSELDRETIPTFVRHILNASPEAGFFAALAVIITVMLAIPLSLSPWMVIRERRTWLEEWENGPREGVAALPSFRSSPRLTLLAVMLSWLSHAVVVLPGLGVVLLGSAWIFGIEIGAAPVRWILPFVWYEEALGRVWGDGVGSWAARAFVVFVLAPALLWLGMLGWSFRRSARSLGRVARAGRDRQRHPIVARFHALCVRLGLKPPPLRVDEGSAAWPRASTLLPLPRFQSVTVSRALAEELTRAQFDFVLAHELGHLRMHGRRLWLAQTVSLLSLFEPGYLTLALDYRRMEFEADEFAAGASGRNEEVEEMLERLLPIIGLRAMLRLDRQGRGRQGGRDRVFGLGFEASEPRRSGSVHRLVEIYDFYLGSALWGEFHPTAQERAARLRARRLGEAARSGIS